MIEAHELPSANPSLDPYNETQDYTTRLILQQNESLIRAVQELAVNIDRMANYMPQQLSKDRPQIIDMGPKSGKPGAGSTAGASYQTTVRFRVESVMFGGGAPGDNFRITIGTQTYNFYGTGSMQFLPFPIQLDRGVDVTITDVTTPTNTAWTFMIFGYPE